MRTRYSLTILSIFLSLFSFAQIKAVTDSGDEVILSSDGTWKYVEEVKNNDDIELNPLEFKKVSTAHFLLKSKKTQTGFWLDAKKWNFEKSTDGTTEYSFSLKDNSSIGAIVLTEQVGIPIKNLRKFAIEAVQKGSSKFRIAREEYRMVNGLKILYVQWDATVEGVDLSYMNYYYSDSVTSVQFLAYAPKLSGSKFLTEGMELLNGLCIINGEAGETTSPTGNEIQSSLVDSSDCKKMLKGSWSYVANGKKYIDKYEPGKILESTADNKYQSVYQMTWTDNCHYELKVLSSNDPAMKQFKIGAMMNVEVLSIDGKKMRFAITYAGNTNKGEMTREN